MQIRFKHGVTPVLQRERLPTWFKFSPLVRGWAMLVKYLLQLPLSRQRADDHGTLQDDLLCKNGFGLGFIDVVHIDWSIMT